MSTFSEVYSQTYSAGGVNEGAPFIGENRVAWQFYDGTNTYSFPVNPDSAETPNVSKKITTQATASGKQVIYEGRQGPREMSFSGVILSREQYEAFRIWAKKHKQIKVTDDLGQSFWLYIKNFSPTRVKNNTYDWYITYTMSGVVLDRG